MKDFFLLVKVLLAGNIKITPAKKQRSKPKNYLLSYVLSIILSTLSITIILTSSTIGNFIATNSSTILTDVEKNIFFSDYLVRVSSSFLISFLFINIAGGLNNYFPKNDEFIRFLPIKGKRLFYARFFLSTLQALLMILPTLLIQVIIYASFTHATFLSALLGIIYVLSISIAIPIIAFILIMLFVHLFKINTNKKTKAIFYVVSFGLFAIYYFSTFLAVLNFSFSDDSSFINFRNAISFIITPFTFLGNGLKTIIDLDNYLYLLILLGIILLTAFLIIFNHKFADKYYIQRLGENEYYKKSKQNKKVIVSDSLINEKISSPKNNSLKAYIKLAFGNIKHNLSFYVGQFIAMSFAFAIFTSVLCLVGYHLLHSPESTNIENPIVLFSSLQSEDFYLYHNIAFIVAANIITFAASSNSLIFISVSVERNNFFMLKSFPIDKRKYFLSKFISSSLYTLPLILISSILVSVFVEFAFYEFIALFGYVISAYILGQFIYAIFGFLKPNFNMILTFSDATTRSRKGSFKYSLYQSGINFLAVEPLNYLIIISIIFIILKLPVYIVSLVLIAFNIIASYFMYKLVLKSLDFTFSKEYNI